MGWSHCQVDKLSKYFTQSNILGQSRLCGICGLFSFYGGMPSGMVDVAGRFRMRSGPIAL
jgi:hypothetical protein